MNINELQEKDSEKIVENCGLVDIEKIKINAKKNKIINYILKNASEFEQKLYLTVLCSMVDNEENIDVRNNQLMFISQMIEGSSKENTLEDLMIKSKIIDNKFLADFAENITNKISESFIVDTLILCSLNPKNKKMLEYITEFFTLINCDEKDLNIYYNIAQAVYTKDIDKLHKIPNILLGNFAKYIDPNNNIYYTDDFFSCRNIDGEIFVIGQTITKESFPEKEVNALLNIWRSGFYGNDVDSTFYIYDHISSKKVTFSNCTFKKFSLITANGGEDDTLHFVDCSFYDCGSNYYTALGRSQTFYSNNMKFVLFDHCYFNGCKSYTGNDLKKCMITINGDGQVMESKYENCHTNRYSNL